MNTKKFKKILVAILTISLICSFFISQETHHIDTCHDENCQECSIIHFAQVIINLIVVLFIYIITKYLINYIIAQIHKEQKIANKTTLVFLKVQMNN